MLHNRLVFAQSVLLDSAHIIYSAYIYTSQCPFAQASPSHDPGSPRNIQGPLMFPISNASTH
jgi:hypothetical protein